MLSTDDLAAPQNTTMESSPNDRILMPAASHASELASGLAQEKQEEAAAARLEAALSFDRPPTPSPSPTQPSVAKDPGHITLPAPSSGAAVAAGRAAEQEEARKGASMEKALEIARGPPVTPERMGIKSEPATGLYMCVEV